VIETESALKRTHLRLLLRVKNVLTEEQQRALRDQAGAPAAPR
jgi:hypothetical protein